MSQQSCTACNDLREYAPDFVLNGVTDDICESLATNTGLNDNLSPKHEDCDDLHDINDCLIGNMDDEVESFEVCDWKDFMHQYIPNNYETLKAMICSMCGQWERIEDMCALINGIQTPPVKGYGTRPNTHVDRRCGTIPNKNGSPILIKMTNPFAPGTEQYESFNDVQNAGIYYGKREMTACDSSGKCKRYEWIMPNIYNYQLSANAEIGDVLWYVSKSALQSVSGFSDYLWHRFEISTYTWSEIPVTSGAKKGKYAHFEATVNPGGLGANYFGIVFTGSSYPNEEFGYDATVANQTNGYVLYPSNCDE